MPSFPGIKLVTAIYSNSCFHLKINKNTDNKLYISTDVFDEVKLNIGHWFYMLKNWMEEYRSEFEKKIHECMNKIKNQRQSEQNETIETYDKHSKMDKT
jgi:hypothetical protein